jgi:DNA polymerase IIIc chi subunit
MKEWWGKNKDNVLLGLLVAYVISLAVVTVDQVFGPWIFLPEMDRQIKVQITKLASNDATAQKEAFDDLVKTKGDFAVKALVKLLDKTDSQQAKANAMNALKTITGQDLGNNPDSWKLWYQQHKNEYP